METKAHHVLIGAFALGMIVLGFLFVMFLGQYRVTQDAFYDVKFLDSVTGLSVGGEVRYNGVKVGEVAAMRFDPSEPKAVYVTIRVDQRPDFALHEDTEITLELLGITGLTYVHIEGVSPTSPRLPQVTSIDGDLPVIVAKPSAIQQLFESAPSIIEQVQLATNALSEFLSEDNQRAVTNILANLDQLTGEVAARGDDIGDTIASMQDVSAQLESLAAKVDTLIGEDVSYLVTDLRQLTNSVNGLVLLAEDVVDENRDGLAEFSNQGLPQISLFLSEARQLVATLDRIAHRVESDPTGFIFRGQGSEYEARP